MKLRYVKADPSGNTTVFILDAVSHDMYARVARAVMSDRYLQAEQVGFIRASSRYPGSFRMHMAGGEFCGNGSRSFAAWLALRGNDGTTLCNFLEKERKIQTEVSGSNRILEATVRNLSSDHRCNVSIGMPIPRNILHGENEELGEYSIVLFDGINHLVLWNRAPATSSIEPARTLLEKSGFSTDAFGVMFYREKENILTPVVYVEDVGLLVWENSCGSGSAAVGAAWSSRNGSPVELTLNQPGGNLTVKVEWLNRIDSLTLSGDIVFTSAGVVYIEDERC